MSGGGEPASRGAFAWHRPEDWDRGLLEMARARAEGASLILERVPAGNGLVVGW